MILYLDCFSGASGDMLAAALLAAAGGEAPEKLLDDVVRPALAAVGIGPQVVSLQQVRRGGFAAWQFAVADGPGFDTMRELAGAVSAAGLPAALTAPTVAMAAAMGAAEREVHGAHEEHLHELAGLDTIVDLLSVAALIAHLAPDEIVASPPALGDGFVRTAHGVLAVPAPAVTVLLRGLPTAGAGVATGGSEPLGELTTPTGAALLAQFAQRFGGLPAGAVVACGHGAGARETPGRANVLRAFLIDEHSASPHAGPGPDGEFVLLETSVDDAGAEVLAHAADSLRIAGAVDVWLTGAIMKKGRPGTVVHVLARAADRERLASVLFRETTTFGVRVSAVERLYLREARERVSVSGGEVAVRLGYDGDELVTASPEYEDCRALAERLGLPLKRVYEEAQAAAWKAFGGA